MAKLTPDATRTIEISGQKLVINEKIIPWGAVWPKNNAKTKNKKGDRYKADRKLSRGTGKVGGVTIHNTADLDNVHDDAEQYARAVWPNANMNDVRVHYFVDDVSCWQQLRDDEVSWHAGDGRGDGNETTISIEIIMRGDGSAADIEAERRGTILAAHLLKKYGLGIDKLHTHNRWMGLPDSIKYGARKNCPLYILPHWGTFKNNVSALMRGSASSTEEQKPNGSTPASYLVRVTADVLNIRKGPGTNYGTNGSIKDKGVYTIVAESAGSGATKWGKLKSGAGWISLDYVKRR